MASTIGGPLPAALLAFTIGALALGLVMLGTRTPLPSTADIAQVPPWVWLGGLIGILVVLLSIVAVPRLGVASYMVAVIAGQLMASHAYDRFGAFGTAPRDFALVNAVGLLMVLAGAALVIARPSS
jgi:transporter family-2 protein